MCLHALTLQQTCQVHRFRTPCPQAIGGSVELLSNGSSSHPRRPCSHRQQTAWRTLQANAAVACLQCIASMAMDHRIARTCIRKGRFPTTRQQQEDGRRPRRSVSTLGSETLWSEQGAAPRRRLSQNTMCRCPVSVSCVGRCVGCRMFYT